MEGKQKKQKRNTSLSIYMDDDYLLNVKIFPELHEELKYYAIALRGVTTLLKQ